MKTKSTNSLSSIICGPGFSSASQTSRSPFQLRPEHFREWEVLAHANSVAKGRTLTRRCTEKKRKGSPSTMSHEEGASRLCWLDTALKRTYSCSLQNTSESVCLSSAPHTPLACSFVYTASVCPRPPFNYLVGGASYNPLPPTFLSLYLFFVTT